MKIELTISEAVKLFQLYRSNELGTLDIELKSITNVHFRGIHAPGVDLFGADLGGADFTGAQLPGAIFDGGNLIGAKLNAANLSAASLFGAELLQAELQDALLSGADLREADLCGADLRGATLDGANLEDAVYDWHTKWPTGFEPRSFGAVPLWQRQVATTWSDMLFAIGNFTPRKLDYDGQVPPLPPSTQRKPVTTLAGWAMAAVTVFLTVVFIGFIASTLTHKSPIQPGASPSQVAIVTVLPTPTLLSVPSLSESVLPTMTSSLCNDTDSQAGVRLYAEANFEGECVHLTEGEYELGNTQIGDNQVSSLRINGDYFVTLFVDTQLLGESRGIIQNEVNLDTGSLGGRYSSIRVEKMPILCRDTNQPGLYLYSEVDYQGNCIYVTGDLDNFADTPVGDNGPRSLRIVGVFDVRLYEGVEWSGRYDEFSRNQDDRTWRSLGEQYSSVRFVGSNEP